MKPYRPEEIPVHDDHIAELWYPRVCMYCGEQPSTRLDPHTFKWTNPWCALLLLLGPLGWLLASGAHHEKTVMLFSCNDCWRKAHRPSRQEVAAVANLLLLIAVGVHVAVINAMPWLGGVLLAAAVAPAALLGLKRWRGRISCRMITPAGIVLRMPNRKYPDVYRHAMYEWLGDFAAVLLPGLEDPRLPVEVKPVSSAQPLDKPRRRRECARRAVRGT